MADKTPIGPGTRVHLRFSLSLESGQLVDSTGTAGASFVVGDGNLLPGFERAMYGLHAGESRTLTIEKAHGFGEVNQENIQRLPRTSFDRDIKPEPGLVVSFADQQQTELPGVVREVRGDMVEVDFNHPLAGKNLLFEVDIISVEQVSNEITRM